MDLKLLKMRCKDSKQHHVMFHELYSVSLPLCIAQNIRFEIPYKVLYFETPFLMIFKYYAWVFCGKRRKGLNWLSSVGKIRFSNFQKNAVSVILSLNE